MIEFLKGFYNTLGLLGISVLVFSFGGAVGLSTGTRFLGYSTCLCFLA